MPATRPYYTAPDEYLRMADQDRALLRKIASGDEDAFVALYDAHAPLLMALAVRMLRSIADAEEVVQEVFLDVWRDPVRADDSSAGARLVSFARTRSLLRLRARGHKRGHHPLDSGGSPSLREEGALGREADFSKGSALAAAAGKLSGLEQRVLALAFYEGLTIHEISELLGDPPGAILATLGSALTAFCQTNPVARVAVCSKGEEFSRYAAAEALAALDGEEAVKFQAHLALPCSVCRSDVRGYRETAMLTPYLLPHAPLSPDVKERILFSVRLSRVAASDIASQEEPPASDVPLSAEEIETVPEAPQAVLRRPWLVVAGVFVALLVLVGVAAYVNTLIDMVHEQTSAIQDQELVVANLTISLDAKRAVLGILESPSLEVVSLKGVGSEAKCYGKFFWDMEKNEAVVQVSRPTGIGTGEEYRLRIILKGKDTLDAGLTPIDSSEDGRSYFVVRGFPGVAHANLESIALMRQMQGSGSSGSVVMSGAVRNP